MQRVLSISNEKYNVIKSSGNTSFFHIVLEKNNKKYFIKILKNNNEEFINSLNGEIDFLINNNINYIPKIVSYERSKYILYEYIDGKTLKQVKPSFKESISIIIKLCNILKEVHDLGYCHNDIKSSNIIISNDLVYLIDFGNCLKFNDIANFCSPKSASYELLHKEKVNYLSDIYSVGKVLRELVVDNRDDINRIIDKCINLDKSKRYQSIIELKNDLLKIIV